MTIFSKNRKNFLKRRLRRRFRALRARKPATLTPPEGQNLATLTPPLGKWSGGRKVVKKTLVVGEASNTWRGLFGGGGGLELQGFGPQGG